MSPIFSFKSYFSARETFPSYQTVCIFRCHTLVLQRQHRKCLNSQTHVQTPICNSSWRCPHNWGVRQWRGATVAHWDWIRRSVQLVAWAIYDHMKRCEIVIQCGRRQRKPHRPHPPPTLRLPTIWRRSAMPLLPMLTVLLNTKTKFGSSIDPTEGRQGEVSKFTLFR